MTQEERRAALLRLTVLVQEVAATQTALVTLLAVPSEEPLWDAKHAASVLNVSPDYVRDHGAALGIEAELGDGVHRYVPERVRALRESRKQAEARRLLD